MKPKPKRGRPKLPAGQRGRRVALYLSAAEVRACLARGKTVQDGIRAIIAAR